MKLKYVVITSVDRDDLPDRGAGHFAECVKEVRALNPGIKIEILVPDFRGRISLYKRGTFSKLWLNTSGGLSFNFSKA